MSSPTTNNVVSNNQDNLEKACIVLKNVYDPEVGLNVVDLGLIYQIDFFEEESGNHLHCLMTLTTEFCPMGESITENVTSALEQTFDDYDIELELTFEPPWSFELISPEGRIYLGR